METTLKNSAVSTAIRSAGSEPQPRPASLQDGDYQVSGPLNARLHRNFDRLESELYQPPYLFERMIGDEWPGDTEGRTCLALVLLEGATGRKAKFLESMVAGFDTYTNKEGYFGAIHLPKKIDEQQLASHGWVLRALCEHHLLYEDAFSRSRALTLIEKLALPTAGKHEAYPIEKNEARSAGGEASGSIIEDQAFGLWRISSDTGCIFIFLDGLIQAHFLFQTGPNVRAIIDEMVARFLEMDFVQVKAQTHATLTALRALLRLEAEDRDPSLLSAVEVRYKAYREQGLTENFENYNWFGRPLWTEPCAIVDSLLLAFQLWRATGKPCYLEDAQLIYYNGIAATQRSNGGFGCNTCARSDDPILRAHVEEAYWCCTMRGAEGLVQAARSIAYADEGNAYITRPESGHYALHGGSWSLELEIKSGYPYTASLSIRIVMASGSTRPDINIFLPSWINLQDLKVNEASVHSKVGNHGFMRIAHHWQMDDCIDCDFQYRLQSYPASSAQSGGNWETLRHGPLILASKTPSKIRLPDLSGLTRIRGNDDAVYSNGLLTLSPVGHFMNPAFEKLDNPGRQILYPEIDPEPKNNEPHETSEND